MFTQLNRSLGNKLLLTVLLSKNKAEAQTPFFFDMYLEEDTTWFLKTDLPLRPGHRSVNNVNESTITSCHIISMSPVYSEITPIPANKPGKGCYITVTFEFLAGRTEEE